VYTHARTHAHADGSYCVASEERGGGNGRGAEAAETVTRRRPTGAENDPADRSRVPCPVCGARGRYATKSRPPIVCAGRTVFYSGPNKINEKNYAEKKRDLKPLYAVKINANKNTETVTAAARARRFLRFIFIREMCRRRESYHIGPERFWVFTCYAR